MANKLFTSKHSAEVIDQTHEILGYKNSYFLVARLALSIGLNSYRETNDFQMALQDTTGKEFNDYTLFNDIDWYKTIIQSIIRILFVNLELNEDSFFWNQSIVKRLIDDGCFILSKLLKESYGDKDIFLKKIYSLKYDKVFQANVLENQPSSKVNSSNGLNVSNEEEGFINEMMGKTQEFLKNFNYDVKDIWYSLSSAVLRIKVKLPLWKSINLIYSKEDDLKLHLWINSSIIIAPISGYLCFDLQRPKRETVFLKDLIDRIEYSSSVKFPLWLSVDNEVISLDLSDANTPHLLIAWSTWQWKSEAIKSIIGTLINKNSSQDLRLILIDPKKVEFSRFKGIPHLSGEIITEVEEAIVALEEAVLEMNKRYDLLRDFEVNNIDKYNLIASVKMPHIVIIFDEFADFILNSKSSKERIESSIMKLSWKARASWIHLILSTQRPDKDIVTWVIKANLPAKIAFKTSTSSNSQIILDSPSAGHLFGRGDMLLAKEWVLTRVQGSFISDEDLNEYILMAK
jgi:DNA segregation ATPase FtsK/SpoIIIE-like protein